MLDSFIIAAIKLSSSHGLCMTLVEQKTIIFAARVATLDKI